MSATRNKKNHKKKQFLEAFPKFKTIWATCRHINIDRKTFYNWRTSDAEFRAAYEVADVESTEILENIAYNRAEKGSDQLLIFLLKSRDREKYTEHIQHDLDPKIADFLVSQFISVVKRNVQDVCPHCNNHLGISNKIAADLEILSEKMGAL